MRFKWIDSKALILKSRKELITSLVAAAVVTAAGFAIGSASLASAQDLSRRPRAAEAAFLKEDDAAMTKMMNDMAVKPTGDVDHDFVAMMAPHHLIFQAIHNLRDRLHETIHVEDLALAAHMIPATFHRQFKSVTGMAPLQYQK